MQGPTARAINNDTEQLVNIEAQASYFNQPSCMKFTTTGGTMTGVKITLHWTQSLSFTGTNFYYRVYYHSSASGDKDSRMGSLNITKPEPPCYKTTVDSLAFTETTGTIPWSFLLWCGSPVVDLPQTVVENYVGNNPHPGFRFRTHATSNYDFMYTWSVGGCRSQSPIQHIRTYPGLPCIYERLNEADANYTIDYITVDGVAYGSTYAYDSTYEYRKKP